MALHQSRSDDNMGSAKVEEFVDAYYARRRALPFQLLAAVQPSRACQELLVPCSMTDTCVFHPTIYLVGETRREK